ncbi:MAG: hypothetical protein OXT67_05415 [Zetaproteobacteria bacterium]|nr:hypothetical protein [Zetaproteobacteria bacterium]
MNWNSVFDQLPLTSKEAHTIKLFLKDPGSIRFLGASKILTKQGKNSECLSLLQWGIQQNPSYTPGIIYLAERLYSCGFISDASLKLDTLKQKDILKSSLAIELKSKSLAIREKWSELNQWIEIGLKSFPNQCFFSTAWDKLKTQGLSAVKQWILDCDFTPHNVTPMFVKGASYQSFTNIDTHRFHYDFSSLTQCKQYKLDNVCEYLYSEDDIANQADGVENDQKKLIYQDILKKLAQVD